MHLRICESGPNPLHMCSVGNEPGQVSCGPPFALPLLSWGYVPRPDSVPASFQQLPPPTCSMPVLEMTGPCCLVAMCKASGTLLSAGVVPGACRCRQLWRVMSSCCWQSYPDGRAAVRPASVDDCALHLASRLACHKATCAPNRVCQSRTSHAFTSFGGDWMGEVGRARSTASI